MTTLATPDWSQEAILERANQLLIKGEDLSVDALLDWEVTVTEPTRLNSRNWFNGYEYGTLFGRAIENHWSPDSLLNFAKGEAEPLTSAGIKVTLGPVRPFVTLEDLDALSSDRVHIIPVSIGESCDWSPDIANADPVDRARTRIAIQACMDCLGGHGFNLNLEVPDRNQGALRKVLHKDNVIVLLCESAFYGLPFKHVCDQMVQRMSRTTGEGYAEAKDLAASVIRYAQGQVRSIESERARLVSSITARNGQVSRARQALLDVLRELRTDQVRLRTVEKAKVLVSLDAFDNLSQQVSAIRSIPAVRECNLNGDTIEVKMVDAYITTGEDCRCDGDDECRCPSGETLHIPGLTFRIFVGDSDRGSDLDDIEVGGDHRYIHPHVNDPHPCFGTAEARICEALAMADYESLMYLMMGWALQYNHDSPHHTWNYFDPGYYNGKRGWDVG